MEYNLGRVEDIISAFTSIQQKQETTNEHLYRLSTTVSAINAKVVNRLEVLKSQIYVFSSSMGWLGVWDNNTGDYKGFVNVGTSSSAEITIAEKTGDVFLLAGDGHRIFKIDPYLPAIKGVLLFEAVASFTVSPGGKRIFVSQDNSNILLEIDVQSANIIRKLVLPGTGRHMVYPKAYLIYFSVAGTKAVYSVQHLSGEVAKVFDLPDDAVKMAPYKFGNKFGLLVLSGNGDAAAITRWDNATNTTSTVQVPNASEIVVNPYTGQYYVASMQNVIFMSLDGTVLKTVDLGDTAGHLTLTADGNHLVAVVSAGNDSLIVDTITGVVSTGPRAIYPPTQQVAELLVSLAQFGFTSN